MTGGDATAADRLARALGALAHDAALATVAHGDVHHGSSSSSSTSATDPGAIAVAVATECPPALTGVAGEVAVPVTPATYPTPLGAVDVDALAAGSAVTAKHAAQVPGGLPAGADHVVVKVSPVLERGLYIGVVHGTPFAIYLDGVPPT